MEAIDVDTATMEIADANSIAIRRRKHRAIESGDAAVCGLLMAVIGDRPDLHRERRVDPGLLLVISGFDEMEEMVGGPVTHLDDGAPLAVPRDAVGIARALRKNLKLARARMKLPHRGG